MVPRRCGWRSATAIRASCCNAVPSCRAATTTSTTCRAACCSRRRCPAWPTTARWCAQAASPASRPTWWWTTSTRPLAGNLDTLAVGGRTAWWVNDPVRVGVTAAQAAADRRRPASGGGGPTASQDREQHAQGRGRAQRWPGHRRHRPRWTAASASFVSNTLASDTRGANAWRVEGQADLADFEPGQAGHVSAYAQTTRARASPRPASGEQRHPPGGRQRHRAVRRPHRAAPEGRPPRRAQRLQQPRGRNPGTPGESMTAGSSAWACATTTRPAIPSSPPLLPTTRPWWRQSHGRHRAARLRPARGVGVYGFAQKTLGAPARGWRTTAWASARAIASATSSRCAARLRAATAAPPARPASTTSTTTAPTSMSPTWLDTGRTDENLIGSRRHAGRWRALARRRRPDVLRSTARPPARNSGLTHAYGVQYAPDTHWTFGANVENGWIGAETLGATDRRAWPSRPAIRASVKYSGGMEYRQGRHGAPRRRTSWLVKNSLSWKVDNDARWLGKFNWADSDSTAGALAAAKYTEAMLGYALRPALQRPAQPAVQVHLPVRPVVAGPGGVGRRRLHAGHGVQPPASTTSSAATCSRSTRPGT